VVVSSVSNVSIQARPRTRRWPARSEAEIESLAIRYIEAAVEVRKLWAEYHQLVRREGVIYSPELCARIGEARHRALRLNVMLWGRCDWNEKRWLAAKRNALKVLLLVNKGGGGGEALMELRIGTRWRKFPR
jgi:hypothetical protein